MSDEFRNKPLPGDWILPPEVGQGLDGLQAAILSERDIEGVPIPFVFQISRYMSEVIAQLYDDQDAQSVLGNIKHKFSDIELRYPEAPAFDRLRSEMVGIFLGQGHEAEASDLLWTINSPHIFAATAMGLYDQVSAQQRNEIITKLMSEETTRHIQIVRAMRDWLIANTPDLVVLPLFNDYLMRKGVEKNPIDGWIESQSALTPHRRWDLVAILVRDEPMWAELPIPSRQHVLLNYMDMVDQSLDTNDDNWMDATTNYFTIMEQGFPEVPAWDHLRSAFTLILLERGNARAGLMLACSISDPELMSELTQEFIEQGYEQEAIELAVANPSAGLTIDLLIDSQWIKDADAPRQKIDDIVHAHDTDSEKRLGYLEALKLRFLESGRADIASRYQTYIDDLRQEWDD